MVLDRALPLVLKLFMWRLKTSKTSAWTDFYIHHTPNDQDQTDSSCYNVQNFLVVYFFSNSEPQKSLENDYFFKKNWSVESHLGHAVLDEVVHHHVLFSFVHFPLDWAKWALTIKAHIYCRRGLCSHNFHQRWDSIIHERKYLLDSIAAHTICFFVFFIHTVAPPQKRWSRVIRYSNLWNGCLNQVLTSICFSFITLNEYCTNKSS